MRYLNVLFICIAIYLAEGHRSSSRSQRGNKSSNKQKSNKQLNSQKDYFARIIQLPSVYQSCNAFFVGEDILIAPASCLLCNEVCDFQVVVKASNGSAVYEVKNISVHPKFYIQDAQANPGFNIALVKISEPAKDVGQLVITRNLQAKEGYFRAWTFNEDMTKYSLKTHIVEKITHYVCDENQVRVRLDEICVQGTSSIELGKYNEGTAFVIDSSNSKSPSVAMGFYSTFFELSGPSKYYSFVSIPYYFQWLNNTIKELSD